MAVRKLVVCCDGTWNTPRNETNVFRTYRFLRERLGSAAELTHRDGVTSCGGRATDGSEVLLYYDRGIGTDWFSRLIGGAAGVGPVRERPARPITSSARTSPPGSEIYVFGFSRGAYTARSLCGFVKAAGLLVRPSPQGRLARLQRSSTPPRRGSWPAPRGWSPDRSPRLAHGEGR